MAKACILLQRMLKQTARCNQLLQNRCGSRFVPPTKVHKMGIPLHREDVQVLGNQFELTGSRKEI